MNHSLLRLTIASLSLASADEVALFNGKDLSGWKEPHGTWSVVRGVALVDADQFS